MNYDTRLLQRKEKSKTKQNQKSKFLKKHIYISLLCKVKSEQNFNRNLIKK